MSLLKKIGKGLKNVVSKVGPIASLIPGPVGAIAGVAGSVLAARNAAVQPTGMVGALPALGGVVRSLPAALPRVLPGVGAAVGRGVSAIAKGGFRKWSKAAAKAAGYTIVGQAIYDAAGNLVGHTSRRRINPLNHRALSRAITRVCSAKKIVKKIEKLTGGTKRRVSCATKGKRC